MALSNPTRHNRVSAHSRRLADKRNAANVFIINCTHYVIATNVFTNLNQPLMRWLSMFSFHDTKSLATTVPHRALPLRP